MSHSNNGTPGSQKPTRDWRDPERLRERARELHGKPWVIEIADDAHVEIRGPDEPAIVHALIYVTEDD